MKSIFKSFLLFTIIATCMSGCSIGPKALNMNEEKYYCPETPSSSYNFNDLYIPSEDCSTYKSLSSFLYNVCLDKNNKLKARYDAGKCEKVVVKQHLIGGAKCKVEIIENSKKRISTVCSGNDTDKAMEKLRNMYE